MHSIANVVENGTSMYTYLLYICFLSGNWHF